MTTVEDYQEGFLAEQEGAAELLKAMQAGSLTGRDTANRTDLTYEPLKAESLERTLKNLEFRTQDIKLWNAVPKLTAYNTVEEFLQLSSYGSERGGFYNEGELSEVEDSQYIRRSEQVKYMQVTGEVTIQAQMTRNFVNAMTKETENKMQWILRLANRSLTKADSDIVPQEFNGIYKQHASIGGNGFLYPNMEAYYAHPTVVDLRGASLKQEDVEKGAVIVDDNYGAVSSLWSPTSVISALAQDYYKDQRIIQNASEGYKGVIGTVPKSISTTLGDVALMSDKFMKQGTAKNTVSPADHSKAAPAPVADGVTPNALAVVTNAKFTAPETGTVYYAVASVNRYGESGLTVLGSAIAITLNRRVDLKFTAGSGGTAATGYVIYRTKVTAAGSAVGLSFYPIFRISVADLAAGVNGAAAGSVGDLGYFMPDTEQAFLSDMSEEVMSFKQLAPMSKLDLAVIAMARRFIVFMFGTPQLYAPKKIVRYINVGKVLTA
jgi:hypothetical protein